MTQTNPSKPLRVLHGPVNVGNQPWALSQAERRQGVASEVVITYNTWLNYGADRTLGAYGEKSASAYAKRIAFGLQAPFRYDVLHYYFGRSYLFFEDSGGRLSMLAPLLAADIRLARLAGAKIFMTLQGCDTRLAGQSNARNAWTMCAEGRCSVYGNCIATYDAGRKRMIDRILPLCDGVFYLNPELGHELPSRAQFLPYASCEIDTFTPVYPSGTARPRIVHAPSNGGIKGTPMILAALEQLKSRFDFELVLVENTPHEEALKIYQTCDIAIDQILAGWYGGYAVEMMAMGKPVACAIRPGDLAFVPDLMRADLPLLRLQPDTLVDDLAAILSAQDKWPEWGRQSRAFVERWHNPAKLATAMIAAYRDPASRLDVSGVAE
jgi:hypothetical protein